MREVPEEDASEPAVETTPAAAPSVASLLRSHESAESEIRQASVEVERDETFVADETVTVTADAEVSDASIDAAVIATESVEIQIQSQEAAKVAGGSVDASDSSAIPASTPTSVLTPQTPSFTRQPAYARTHPRTAKWQWAALVALSLLLLVQVLIADRARLAADASWRPLISGLCGVANCTLPAWRQPGAFAMLSRDVRPIAGRAGGLEVQATFRNDARWAQAWPVLLLSLSDADGRVVGARAFTAREYLGASATQNGLAPGQSARIALQLHEPNPAVVAFSFDFR